MRTISENRAFGGVQGVYSHTSEACQCDMTFGLFLPEEAEHGPVPVLWYLSGLTCTHENAMVKSGAQRWAAEAGIALVFPDTSPRGEGVADDAEYDLGQGAGFYVDAMTLPWARHYHMWSYITDELPAALFNAYPLAESAQSITGHSMGGHGALTMAMSLPGRFRSVSAFAPICHPTNSLWGRKQFTAYLGVEEEPWAAHDATLLMKKRGFDGPILIDQGRRTGSWNCCNPRLWPPRWPNGGKKGRFGCRRGMITVISSSRPSWKSMSISTPGPCVVRGRG
jgi:S-formylglutathione hydrolase